MERFNLHQKIWLDGVHPTSAAQAIIAEFAESLIEDPTQYSLLAELPLGTRASHVRTHNDGLLMAREAPVGKLTGFASGDGGSFDIDPGAGNSGLDSDPEAATVGVTVRASEALTLGIAYGQARANASFGGVAGRAHIPLLEEKT